MRLRLRCGCSFILFTDVDIDRKIEFKFRQVDTDDSGHSLTALLLQGAAMP
jgi:hypothetical protein